MPPKKLPRFLVTFELSRLARWLRLLGYDAVITESSRPDALKRVCSLQNRILLTGCRKQGKLRFSGKVVIVISRIYTEQLRQVVSELQLQDFRPFSRCLHCNRAVFPIEKQRVMHKLPEKVKSGQEEFTVCRKCGRIFWQGTHYLAMLKTLEQSLPGINPVPEG